MEIVKYCLYDPDFREIVSNEVFDTYEDAAEAAEAFDDVLVVRFKYEGSPSIPIEEDLDSIEVK